MSGAGTNDESVVVVIEESPLARKYLLEILSHDTSVRVVTLSQLGRLPGPEREHAIFLIDQLALSSPLSECLRRLRVLYPRARFLLLSVRCSQDEVDRLLWLGVHGVLKHADAERELTRAIAGLRAGQTWFPAGALRTHQEALKSLNAAGGRSRLTQREHDVLELIKRRFSNREIADALRIKESTVKFHVGNIFVKQNAVSRRELTSGTAGVASGLAAPNAAEERGS